LAHFISYKKIKKSFYYGHKRFLAAGDQLAAGGGGGQGPAALADYIHIYIYI
jgi:hypothetical protein